MYAELVASLTVNDRKALAERGVPNARVSEWRTGLRLPTRPQTIALAAVKNVDVMALEAELSNSPQHLEGEFTKWACCV